MDGKMLARLGAVVFVAIAITATAIELTRKEAVPATAAVLVPLPEADPLLERQRRCQLLGLKAAEDAECLRVWAESGRAVLADFLEGGPALSEDPTLEADLDRPAWEAFKDFVFGGDLPLVTWRKHSARRPADGDAARPWRRAAYFSDHIVGCLVILVAITAMAEIVRAVRFPNIALGAWLAAAPCALDGGSGLATAVNLVIGLALIDLSLPRGVRSDQHYGGWDRAIIRQSSCTAQERIAAAVVGFRYRKEKERWPDATSAATITTRPLR
jgi:conjugative transfer region protein TrbK